MTLLDTCGGPPDLDRAGLARRTFGDAGLARELLDLFEAQCVRLRGALAGAGSSPAEALHTLRGAALAVGAERVAALAAACERRPADPSRDATEELLRAVDDVVNVIRRAR